jgi:hypothetical protein
LWLRQYYNPEQQLTLGYYLMVEIKVRHHKTFDGGDGAMLVVVDADGGEHPTMIYQSWREAYDAREQIVRKTSES